MAPQRAGPSEPRDWPFPSSSGSCAPEGSLQASPTSEGCLETRRIQEEQQRDWPGNMKSKQHAASRAVRFLVRGLSSLTFICNSENKISSLPLGQHSYQRLPSPAHKRRTQFRFARQTVEDELAGSPSCPPPLPNSVRSPLRTHFMHVETKVREAAHSWAGPSGLCLPGPAASAWVAPQRTEMSSQRLPGPAQGASRGVGTSWLVDLKPPPRGSWITPRVCGPRGTGSRGPMEPPAPSPALATAAGPLR